MYIASSSTIVTFHDFPSNQLVHTHRPTNKIDGPCRSLSWTKDGGWLALVPYAGHTEIVSIKGQTCKLLHSVQNISEPSCVTFQNSTKRNLAIGTKHGQVLLYDIKSKNIKGRYPRTSSAITHVGFTAKDTHCYAGCASGDVLLFNHVAKNLTCTLKVPKSHSLTTVKAHLQRRNFLVAGSAEGIVCTWDCNVNKTKFHTEAHQAPVSAVVFSPVNSALIVSAGLDRAVRIFDIENKTRISTIPMGTNVLSLDFLQDSLYIAMGGQNGKIHIYDTRNLQDSVVVYEAHKSGIKHLSYQTCSEDGSGESSFLGSDELLTRKSVSNEEIESNKNKRTSDFFDVVALGPASASEICNAVHSQNSSEADSFMKALELSHGTLEQEKNVTDCPQDPSKYFSKVNNVKQNKSYQYGTSTPKFVNENLITHLSPIISATAQPMEIQQPIKEAIRGVVKNAVDDLETKISYKFMDHAHLIRRMILDLHMASLKEFSKMENYCNLIREEIDVDSMGSRENHLREENMILRQRVQELERQIANMRGKQVDNVLEDESDQNK